MTNTTPTPTNAITGGRMVELLTLLHNQGGPAAGAIIQSMERDDLDHLAAVMLGSLYAAAETQCAHHGITVDKFLQVLGLNAQRMDDKKAR